MNTQPRILVKKTASCIVDLRHDLATDLYTLAPPSVFRGKGFKGARTEAQQSADHFGVANYTGAAAQRRDLRYEFDRFMRDADLVVIREVEPELSSYVIVTAVDGTRGKYNAEFWEALEAASDCAMLPRFTSSCGRPAVFFADGEPFALLMPVWASQEWRKGEA